MPAVPTARRFVSAIKAEAVAATTATSFSTQPAAFIASTTGSVVGTLWDDNIVVSIPVVAGVLYPISLKSLDATNAVALHVFYN